MAELLFPYDHVFTFGCVLVNESVKLHIFCHLDCFMFPNAQSTVGSHLRVVLLGQVVLLLLGQVKMLLH